MAPTFNKDATGVIKKTSDKVWLIRLLLIRLQIQLQDSLGTNEVYTIFQWLIIHKLRWQELSDLFASFYLAIKLHPSVNFQEYIMTIIIMMLQVVRTGQIIHRQR